MDKQTLKTLMEHGDEAVQILGDITSLCSILGSNTADNSEVDPVELRMSLRAVGRLAALVNDNIDEMCGIAVASSTRSA